MLVVFLTLFGVYFAWYFEIRGKIKQLNKELDKEIEMLLNQQAQNKESERLPYSHNNNPAKVKKSMKQIRSDGSEVMFIVVGDNAIKCKKCGEIQPIGNIQSSCEECGIKFL